MHKPHLDTDTLRELFESYEIVKDILGEPEKATHWFTIPNPHLGGACPVNFYLVGRGKKVLSFIKNAKDENFP